MSRASLAANSVVTACKQACGLYRVSCIRIQSCMLPGIGRPVRFGEWYDSYGQRQTAGQADLLCLPRIFRKIGTEENWAGIVDLAGKKVGVTVPLWVECKAGKGELSVAQKYFRAQMLYVGAHYVLAEDSADALIAWFDDHGVDRNA